MLTIPGMERFITGRRRGEAGVAETGGDGAVGEGAEGGEDGAMDGNIERAWVGKERQMPYGDLV